MKYIIHLPKDYSGKNRNHPLIFFLHGALEKGNDLNLVRKHGPVNYAEKHDDFPFIIIAPQCALNKTWEEKELKKLLDEIIAKYRVDTSQLYCTGLSMGGFGTWKMAIKYPDLFAAIAPVCGGGNPYRAADIKHIPAWVFHGAKDKIVPLEKSEIMVNAMKAAGAKIKFTIYPEAGHDSWSETYNNPELYNWFLEHSLYSG